ncbi:MAG: alpha/beta fold hydrolase, partial [Bacteroidota bacterium]
SLPNAPYMEYYHYLEDRDLILFEQRGNFYAKPSLNCPEWVKANNKVNVLQLSDKITEAEAQAFLSEAALSCRDRLTKKGIDLNSYRTEVIAADMEDLRLVLGIDQWNLLTVSYSTKIAQIMMRDYPEGIRSVVLDSPMRLDIRYDEKSNENMLSAIQLMLDDCQKNQDCSTAFPNLGERLFTYLEKVTLEPLVLNITDPIKGDEQTFYLRGKDLIELLAAGYTGDVPMLPAQIEAFLQGDMSTVESYLASLLQNYHKGNPIGSGIGMRLSVWCAEEMAHTDPSVLRAETEKYQSIKGRRPETYSAETCDIWSVEAVNEELLVPIQSEIPTLFISGSYDDLTPSYWVPEMMENMPNSYHLVFEGWKHTPIFYWDNSCAMQAARAFFNDPQSRPSPDCLSQLSKPEFISQ